MQGRAVSAFRGFPRQLFTFFEGLCEDNSKAYWTANKATWEEQVRQPMLALLADLALEFAPMRMFRPNRDVRFARDKSPYKLWAGATSECHAVGGAGYYLRVSASGLVTGCGAMAMARDQLQRFRAALDDDDRGHEFEQLLTTLAARSLPVTCGAEPPLKTGPPGYPSTHPRAELLGWKGAVIIQEYDKSDWMHTPVALDRIREVWHGAQPLKEWLDAIVVATDEPVRSARGGQ
jgi:uncharacterized protein (TIGR02453 family)